MNLQQQRIEKLVKELHELVKHSTPDELAELDNLYGLSDLTDEINDDFKNAYFLD